MKLAGLWTIGIGAIVSVGLFAGEQAYAGENGHPAKCTLETLSGQYLVAANGTLFPPAFGVTAQSVSAAAGYSTYNGDGTGTDWVTFSIDGAVVIGAVPTPTPTTYTLNSNCTGTKTVMDGPHFNIFVAIDGSGLTAIATDQGFAVSESDKRVGSDNQ
jgi:hypothetical protein